MSNSGTGMSTETRTKRAIPKGELIALIGDDGPAPVTDQHPWNPDGLLHVHSYNRRCAEQIMARLEAAGYMRDRDWAYYGPLAQITVLPNPTPLS